MKILASDTSTDIITVALCDGDRVLAETIVHSARAHSERLLATVDWVLREAGVPRAELDALAISIGPGSFTGLRIGAAAWKGLAFGMGLPLMPVPTLDALTRTGAFSNCLVCPMLDAKMGEVYGAWYRFDGVVRRKLGGDRVCPLEQLVAEMPAQDGPVFFFGDGAHRYREALFEQMPGGILLPLGGFGPRASTVALEALALFEAGADANPAHVSPVYLRKSQAELAREGATAS